MKLAVLGAGGIVPDFLEAASKIPRAEICAIYGRESSRSRMLAYQAQYGIPHLYMDYGQLLEDRQVEGVYVALPNHLHHEFAKKALEAKKHAIIEKPFASNGRQARELVELAEKNGVFQLIYAKLQKDTGAGKGAGEGESCADEFFPVFQQI